MTVAAILINAIKSNMEAISIANGYSFDIGGRVYDYRRAAIDENWAISLYDVSDDAEDNGYGKHEMSVEVVLTGSSGINTKDDLRERVQDVIRAFSLIENEKDYISSASYDGHDKDVIHDDKIIGEATIYFTVRYSTGRWEM